MEQYFVTVPNLKYDGKTLGVRFNEGKALLDERTIDPQVLKGRTLDDIARQMVEEFGYGVEPPPPQVASLQKVEEVAQQVEQRKRHKPGKREGEYKAG